MTKPLDPIEATTATRVGKDKTHATGGQCANCGATLAGEYCHDCGQHAHNPLASFKHAVEDIFESFWHLDGRIFRTLRNLFVPGRVASEYMAGHRVRYIPPLRLFVILSLLTFFVGKLVLQVEPNFTVTGEPMQFQADDTVAEVEQRRDRMLAEIAREEAETAETPGVSPVLVATRANVQAQAAARIAQLRKQDEAQAAGGNEIQASGTPPDAATDTTTDPAPATRADEAQADERMDCDAMLADSRQAAWVPDFMARWIQDRVRKGCENISHADTESGRLFQQFLGAVPTALFVLMPLFALLLKLVYLGSGRAYLEHLVVALYSHCYLLLTLLALFLLTAVGNAGAPTWLTKSTFIVISIWTPIYLWIMQRRVYGGGWLSNTLRYLVIGFLYFFMVTFATVYAALMGISA